MKDKVTLDRLSSEEIIARLKDGQVAISRSGAGGHYEMINGVICWFGDDGFEQIGADITRDADTYFEEGKDHFEIEGPGMYVTRYNQVAYVVKKQNDICWGYLEDDPDKKFVWTKIGKNLHATDKNLGNDIVAEYDGFER